MPVVGFHQARRPRQSPGERLCTDFSWPRPGGLILSLAGAALVIAGAAALGPSGLPPAASSAAPGASTTPAPTQTPGAPAASPPDISSGAAAAARHPTPASLAPSGGSASAMPPAPLIDGSTLDSPIQRLFASSGGGPLDQALLNIKNPASRLVLVNKRRPLVPTDFVPPDLITAAIPSGSGEPVLVRAEAGAAAEGMFAAAAEEGVIINVKSSFRSYDLQVQLYNSYVADKGDAAADTTSARPGYSEHQTGLAIDIGDANAGPSCDFNPCFADTAAAQWVAEHGPEYGFVVRYLPGDDAVTGYLAEPWHLRYLGAAVARDMQNQGIRSYEEYLGLPGAPGYE